MARIAIAEPFDPIEVDLWGEVFVTQDLARSKNEQAVAIQEKLSDGGEIVGDVPAEGEEDEREFVSLSIDERVDLYADLFDLILAHTDGSKKKPSTLIRRKWKADELSPNRCDELLMQIGLARAKRQIQAMGVDVSGRPT